MIIIPTKSHSKILKKKLFWGMTIIIYPFQNYGFVGLQSFSPFELRVLVCPRVWTRLDAMRMAEMG